jgi:hypothetical protein
MAGTSPAMTRGYEADDNIPLPGLTRQSIFPKSRFLMDARVEPAHDDWNGGVS